MKVDSEEQRRFLLLVLRQAKLTGNYEEVTQLSRQVVDTIKVVEEAGIDKPLQGVPKPGDDTQGKTQINP